MVVEEEEEEEGEREGEGEEKSAAANLTWQTLLLDTDWNDGDEAKRAVLGLQSRFRGFF